jgi:hypothetical protein
VIAATAADAVIAVTEMIAYLAGVISGIAVGIIASYEANGWRT